MRWGNFARASEIRMNKDTDIPANDREREIWQAGHEQGWNDALAEFKRQRQSILDNFNTRDLVVQILPEDGKVIFNFGITGTKVVLTEPITLAEARQLGKWLCRKARELERPRRLRRLFTFRQRPDGSKLPSPDCTLRMTMAFTSLASAPTPAVMTT